MIFYLGRLNRFLCFSDRGEDEMFGDDEEDGDSGNKVPYDYYDDPFDILRLMLNYVDNDAGTCLHLATKV